MFRQEVRKRGMLNVVRVCVCESEGGGEGLLLRMCLYVCVYQSMVAGWLPEHMRHTTPGTQTVNIPTTTMPKHVNNRHFIIYCLEECHCQKTHIQDIQLGIDEEYFSNRNRSVCRYSGQHKGVRGALPLSSMLKWLV